MAPKPFTNRRLSRNPPKMFPECGLEGPFYHQKGPSKVKISPLFEAFLLNIQHLAWSDPLTLSPYASLTPPLRPYALTQINKCLSLIIARPLCLRFRSTMNRGDSEQQFFACHILEPSLAHNIAQFFWRIETRYGVCQISIPRVRAGYQATYEFHT